MNRFLLSATNFFKFHNKNKCNMALATCFATLFSKQTRNFQFTKFFFARQVIITLYVQLVIYIYIYVFAKKVAGKVVTCNSSLRPGMYFSYFKQGHSTREVHQRLRKVVFMFVFLDADITPFRSAGSDALAENSTGRKY